MSSGSLNAAEGLVRLTRGAANQASSSQTSRADAQSRSGPCKALVIASWLFKGGVGKTTTVVNLGGYFASAGIKTLIIDADPQGSATDFFLDNLDENGQDMARQLAEQRAEDHHTETEGASESLWRQHRLC